MLEPESLSLVVKRADFIIELAEQPLEKREMTAELAYSRATVNRAVRALEDAGLVHETQGGYEPTLAAMLAVETYRDFVATETDILDATTMLASLDLDADVPPALLRDADRFPVASSGTYANFERVRESIADANTIDVVVPSARALPALDHWQNAILTTANATIVLEDSLDEAVRRDHRTLSWLATHGVDVLAGDTSEFVLVRITGSDRETVFVLVYDDEAGGFGVLRNDSPAAVDWATRHVESSRTGAKSVAEDFEAPQDARHTSGERSLRSGRLPRVLESEGFVALTAAYFETHQPRDLATALRTGLTLADVRDGNAVERTASEESTSETLTRELFSRLDADEDCAVVGQPGAGKSTVCKAVACEWYERERGPVLYRESGQRKPFESLASLRGYLRETPGDVLVVVEDAVRPEANAVLEVAAEYARSDDVRFLVDARVSDWSETRLLPVDAAVREYKNAGPSVTTLSPPNAAECTRLLERYEAETGTTLDVTGDQLIERIDDAESVSGGMFLLAHHICHHADPVSSVDDVTPTPLVEDVQQRIAALQHDASDVGIEAALLTQFLNVAELPVHEEFLQAQTVGVADLTTDAVLSVLTDRQLLVDDDPEGLRTPHNQWSRVFLTEALEVLVDAPERLGTALTNVFDLTNPETRSALDVRTRNSPLLQRIAADPTDWADDLAEQLFAASEEYLALSPYYGTFENPTFDLEAACSAGTIFECGRVRGQRLSDAGDLETAAAAYRTVVDAIEDHDDSERIDVQKAECMLGLGAVQGRLGDLDAYEKLARRSLELNRENGHEHGQARCYVGLGHLSYRRSDYEQAMEYWRRGASRFDELGDLKREAKCLGNVAAAAEALDDYDTGEEYARRSMEICQDIGTEYGLAQAHMLLGRIAEGRGRFENAMKHHRRSLLAADTVGSDQWRITALCNIGNVAMHLGRLDESLKQFSQAADRNEAEGEPRYDALVNEGIAEIYRRRGDHAAAREHANRALEEARNAGNERIEAIAKTRFGKISLDLEDHETAREELETALETFRELGVVVWRLNATVHLARLQLDVGAFDRAAEHVTAARSLVDVKDDLATNARVISVQGKIRAERGNEEGARESFDEVESIVDDVADTYVQAAVYQDLGEFAMSDGDEAIAVEHFETASELAESIGAERIVSEVEATVESELSPSGTED